MKNIYTSDFEKQNAKISIGSSQAIALSAGQMTS